MREEVLKDVEKIVEDLMQKNKKGLFEKRVDARATVLDLANRGMIGDFWVELEPLEPLIECMRNSELSDEQVGELLSFIATTLRIDQNRLRRFYYNVPEPEFEKERPTKRLIKKQIEPEKEAEPETVEYYEEEEETEEKEE